MEIESPTNAYAFVAAEYISRGAEAPAPTTAPAAAPTKVEPLPAKAVQIQEPPNAARRPPTVPPPPPPAMTTTAQTQPPAGATVQTAPPSVALPGDQTVVPIPSDEPAPRRIVTRDGVVGRTASIQAPTFYALESLDTGKTINYLHTEKIGIELSNFPGRKVQVTGEERVDTRWPKVPVIEVETIRLIP